jgi:hypothetical protein
MKVQLTMHMNIDYISIKFRRILSMSSSSLGSVMDSHAGGPGSIPARVSCHECKWCLKFIRICCRFPGVQPGP